MKILYLQKMAHETSKAKGWWQEWHQNEAASSSKEFRESMRCHIIGMKIALIHSEISEALEEVRAHGSKLQDIRYTRSGKPEGFPIELADAMLRIADLAEKLGINLEEAILIKAANNAKRQYRHGGKAA